MLLGLFFCGNTFYGDSISEYSFWNALAFLRWNILIAYTDKSINPVAVR